MEQEGKKLQGELFSRGFSTDLAAEFVLPDYQPEIKRLLRVRALALPVDQYIGAAGAELSGAVEFQALYAAGDDSLWCVTKREDYQLSCPIEATDEFDLSDAPVCEIQTETEGVSGRVLAPRKLSARCRVRTQVCLLSDRAKTALPPESAEGIEPLTDQIWASRVRIGKSAPFTLTDEILLDPSKPPLRVISASGEVFPTEVKAGTDLVACRGELLLTLLCAEEQLPSLENAEDCLPASALPMLLSRRIPFAVEVPLDGVQPSCACNAWGSCSEVAVTVEESRILCDLTAVLTVRAVCREEFSFVRDAFSTVRLTEPVFRVLPVQKNLCCRNANCSVSATKELSSLGLKPDSRILETTADVLLQAPEAARGNYILPGVVTFHILVLSPDGDVSTCDLEAPFRFETPAETNTVPAKNASVALPVLAKATLDSSRLLAEAELSLALDLSAADSVELLSDLRAGEPLAPRPQTDLRIYYPSPSDSLWSVAALYHTPVATLLKKNHLPTPASPSSPDSLNGVRYLVV